MKPQPIPVERLKHRRARNGTSCCPAPVRQEDLTDDLSEVNCPRCWAAMRARVSA
jgi:hypothetical protein